MLLFITGPTVVYRNAQHRSNGIAGGIQSINDQSPTSEGLQMNIDCNLCEVSSTVITSLNLIMSALSTQVVVLTCIVSHSEHSTTSFVGSMGAPRSRCGDKRYDCPDLVNTHRSECLRVSANSSGSTERQGGAILNL